MKKFIMAAVAAFTIAQPVAAEQWSEVIEIGFEHNAVAFTSTKSVNRPDNFITVFADPVEECKVYLEYSDIFYWESSPEAEYWPENTKDAKVQFRVDDGIIWSADDAYSELSHSPRSKGTELIVRMLINPEIVAEMIEGNKAIFRWTHTDNWNSTASYDVADPTVSRLQEVLDACDSRLEGKWQGDKKGEQDIEPNEADLWN